MELFGEEAENSRFPLIDVGGVVLRGESTAGAILPGDGNKDGEGKEHKPDPKPDHGHDYPHGLPKSDMTRTVVFGTPAPEAQKVFDIVHEAQRSALTTLRR